MKIGFVGGGKMGEAIIASVVCSKIANPQDIAVCDVDETRTGLLSQRYGIAVLPDALAVVDSADTIFLCVKPQNLEALLTTTGSHFTDRHLVISIAAGKKLAWIEYFMPAARVIRVMPNLATVVSEAMSVFCTGRRITPGDHHRVHTLLASFGRAIEMPEEQFDAVTALSGSGPAFVAYFAQAMIDGGIALGMEADDARLLAEQTLLGAAMLLARGGYTEDALIKSVSSPGGTTLAGMDILGRSPFREIVARTMEAAARRSAELSR
jgi:pyrroline-5-carboxylate reductase